MKYIIITTLILVGAVNAYPNGPPVFLNNQFNVPLCTGMIPSGHNATAQTSSPPYEFSINGQGGKDCFSGGDSVSVRLSATDSGGFKGYFIQAKKRGDNGKNYGTFSTGGRQDIKALPCFNTENTALGHPTNEKKMGTEFTWTISDDLPHNVEFVATVVQDLKTVWLDVKSAEFKPCPASGSADNIAGMFSITMLLAICSLFML